MLCICECRDSILTRADGIIRKITSALIRDPRLDIGSITLKREKAGYVLRGETTVPGARDKVSKALDSLGISLRDSVMILPDTTRNKRYYGLATLSVINMRKEPDHASELVSQAVMGTPLIILKNSDGWLLIRTPDRYLGWAEEASVERLTKQELNKWRNSDRVIYNGSSGWLFCTASDTCVMSDIVAGSILRKEGEEKGFLKLSLPDGRVGYSKPNSFMDFNSFKSLTPNRSTIIRTALSLNGIPYLWGGTSSKGVDCSGLTKTVFFLNGLILQRDASQQALYGDQVDISKDFSGLQPCDLLFFSYNGRTITHVALYKGDTEYIQASGRVVINSLDSTRTNYSSYRWNTLVKAMRIIGSKDSHLIRIKDHPLY